MSDTVVYSAIDRSGLVGALLLWPLVGACTSNPETSEAFEPVTVLQATMVEITPFAVTDILPNGINTPFTGVPVDSMFGADSADRILEDFEIPALNTPVVVEAELVLLNERNLYPLDLGGVPHELRFTLNPARRSMGTLTVVQTTPDDGGPGPEGFFLRETNIELLTHLIPLGGGDTITVEGSVFVQSPVPILFSFDPPVPDMLQRSGLVGDPTVAIHTNLGPGQRNFFAYPGMLQVPQGGRPRLDALGNEAARGGSVSSPTARVGSAEECVSQGFASCGIPDVDLNENLIPDYFENSLRLDPAADPSVPTVVYSPATGSLSIRTEPGMEIMAVNLASSNGLFLPDSALNLGGALDTASDVNLRRVGIGETYGSFSLGAVAPTGLTREDLIDDLTVRVLFPSGESRGGLNVVVEPGG